MTFVIGLGLGQFGSCPGQAISPYSPLPTMPVGCNKDMYKSKMNPRGEGLMEEY